MKCRRVSAVDAILMDKLTPVNLSIGSLADPRKLYHSKCLPCMNYNNRANKSNFLSLLKLSISSAAKARRLYHMVVEMEAMANLLYQDLSHFPRCRGR